MISKISLLSTQFGVHALVTLSLSLAACSTDVRVLGNETAGAAGKEPSGGASNAGAFGSNGGASGADDPGSEGGTNSAGAFGSNGGASGADDPGSEGGTNSAGTGAVAGSSAAGSAGRGGASCVVKGVIYADRSTNVPRPDDCNTCTCDDGQLVSCTNVECPTPCPSGTRLGAQCLQCGPADECLAVEHKCLPTCSEQQLCVDLNACIGGLCKELSGICG